MLSRMIAVVEFHLSISYRIVSLPVEALQVRRIALRMVESVVQLLL